MSANRVEKLIYWYLRFNGYLTVENFTIHPNFKRDPEAEADILAVRFSFSVEDPERFTFERDQKLVLNRQIDFIIGEVKSSMCRINDTWEEPDRMNIQYALRWFGYWTDEQLANVSENVYRDKCWLGDKEEVRYVCFGLSENDELKNKYPHLVQVLLIDAIGFVHRRITTNCLKLHRENWDSFINRFVDLTGQGLEQSNLLAWVLEDDELANT